MKKIFFGFLSLLLISNAFCQLETFPSQFIGLNIGKSKHGSGDIQGVAFNTVYSKSFHKKLSWVATFGGTLHDDSKELIFTDPNGNIVDGSIRYTTGGIQSTFGVNYSFIQTKRNEVYLGLNSLFRYQSTSYYDVITVLYPIITGLSIPVIYFENLTPARTFAVGGTIRLGYNYTNKKNILFGIFGDFQMDTNGDVLSQLALTVGKRFY